MSLSTDIKLRRNKVPKFPDNCVACQKAHPECLIRIYGYPLNWFPFLNPRVSVDVPVCTNCRQSVISGRLRRRIIGFFWAVGAATVAFYCLGNLQKNYKLGIAVLLLSPLIVWEMINPLPISLNVRYEAITYEFKNEEYAIAFAELNKFALLKKKSAQRTDSTQLSPFNFNAVPH